MIRGLYTSAMGMTNDEKRMEVLANNLANVNTTGFKKDKAVSASFSEVMTQVINGQSPNNEENGQNNIGKLALGIGLDDTATDFSQGNLVKTDNPLDAALTNSDLAFFCVEVSQPNSNTPQEMYTRDGSFTLNTLGQLTTKDGYLVKGQSGAITLKGSSININPDGSIVQDGKIVDKLLIKEFNDPKLLKKHGGNLIMDSGTSETRPFSGQVVQGSIETSNVNSVSEMVEMISVMRSYEANQKVLRSHDDTLSKAVNDVGRL